MPENLPHSPLIPPSAAPQAQGAPANNSMAMPVPMQQPAQQPAQQELQLADIHLPAKPSAWPPAPGWWILLALFLALFIVGTVKFIRYRRLKKHQQRLLHAVGLLENKLTQGKSTAVIAEINILLRRLALMHYPRQQIASLTGKNWLLFLDESGRTQDFSQGVGKLLADAPYLKAMPESADLQGLSQVVKKWVKRISANKASKVKP